MKKINKTIARVARMRKRLPIHMYHTAILVGKRDANQQETKLDQKNRNIKVLFWARETFYLNQIQITQTNSIKLFLYN